MLLSAPHASISITGDVAVFRKSPSSLVTGFQVLLIKRKKDPFKNKWALPGGFINEEELTANGAYRELYEETGLGQDCLAHDTFVDYFQTPGRDPRGRVISFLYTG